MTTSSTQAATTADSSAKNGRFTVLLAAVAALALVAFMISNVTGAAWTDTTDNPDNSWATGTVSLTDDDEGVALFTAADIVPGYVDSNDITVTNESSVPLQVRMPAVELAEGTNSGLAAALELDITTVDDAHTYDGTLAGFSENGLPEAVVLEPGESRVYDFEVSLPNDVTDPGLQGTTAGITFVWEGSTDAAL